MKKLSLLVLCLLFMFTVALSGCSKSNDTGKSAQKGDTSSAKTKVIKYWYPWGGDSEKWDKWRISEFEKAHPEYKVEATYVPPDAGISNGKLMAAITGGDVPDLIVTSDYASAYSLAVQGAFLPLDDALKDAGFDESKVNPVFKDVMKYKDVTYLFPQDTNVNLLYYNIDLFKEAGLDPSKPPKTIDELDAMAKKLTKINGGKIERLGFIPWIDAGDDAYMWGYMFGANFYDVNANKINLTDGKMAAVLTWEKQYAQQYDPEKIKSFTSGFGGAFSPSHPFMTGKVAMTINGNWFTNALRIYAPKINYGIAPIPAPSGGRYGGSNLGTNVFAVPKGAKNIKGAMDFILFAEQARIEDDNVKTWRSVPALPDQVKDLTLVKEKDPLYPTILDIASNPNSGHTALTSVSKQMSDDLRAIRDKVIYTGADPSTLLKEEEQKLQGMVNRSK
ncbi:ABC transporter substrate-binding protein [Caldanaerobius polysaccharolyticus]|uniref:ABC transporter substrate-binding protein n=1 Tax=Caldanaerobius polysaccharolyticus TaxID=44256 RepID=UPI0004798D15|nr:ABC transporter substrate-binding protein [Caldanaerobius polysaccharolyticus]